MSNFMRNMYGIIAVIAVILVLQIVIHYFLPNGITASEQAQHSTSSLKQDRLPIKFAVANN